MKMFGRGVLYVLFMAFLSIILVFPFSMLGLPWWLILILMIITYFSDIIGCIIQHIAWIAALVVTICNPQDWLSIVYYITFAIIEVPIILHTISVFKK